MQQYTRTLNIIHEAKNIRIFYTISFYILPFLGIWNRNKEHTSEKHKDIPEYKYDRITVLIFLAFPTMVDQDFHRISMRRLSLRWKPPKIGVTGRNPGEHGAGEYSFLNTFAIVRVSGVVLQGSCNVAAAGNSRRCMTITGHHSCYRAVCVFFAG